MAKTYVDFDLPNEIKTVPLALIGVTGLDTVTNPVHRNIWDALVNIRQADRSAVVFKNLALNHQFPPMKNKRNSYEWYVPKGILKRNWMDKHLNQLPAVIVIFYDLDWDDPQWSEKKLDCASRVQSIKASIEGHSFRVVLVLIQQSTPLPIGEDPQSAEKASALCAACEVTPKSLLLLPVADHLQGYILRLEKAFYELALSYYQHEIKYVKSHKDHLNKITHQYLFVRHQFKMGFFYEMKQDSLAARVQYLHAYNSLLEARTSDTNLHEVKTVAAFLIYKICRLFFIMNEAREALLHFTLHIDKFKLRTGPRDLIFEHHAWLSKQYNLFGDLFDEMVKQGLTAGQTQHPGINYEQAARHSINRKLSVQEIQPDLLKYPDNDPLEGWQTLEFYGQRPWRPAKLSAEPPDLVREREAVMALQYREKFIVDHSTLIINLLSKAITQFKTHRCPRMRRQLVVQMADEYYNSRNFGKALTLMNLMLADYQSEKWWGLYVCLLSRALTCAYLTACVQEYFELCLGALSKFDLSQQTRVFKNLISVLQIRIPDPEPGLSEADVVGANEMWLAANKTSSSPSISLSVSPLLSCIQVKAVIQKAACDNVEIKVYIKYCLPEFFKFSQLSICINSASQCFEVCANNVNEDPAQFLAFQSSQVKCYSCNFIPNLSDINTTILIRSVSLKLGLPSENERLVELCFSGAGPDISFCETEFQYLRPNSPNDLNFDRIAPILSAVISPRKSKLTVSLNYEAPALLAEWFEIVVNIRNTEDVDISNVVLEVSSLSSTEFGSEHWLEICSAVSNEPSSFPLVIALKDLKNEAEEACAFYIASHTLSPKELLIKIKYDLAVADIGQQICIKEIPLKIDVCKAFDVTTMFLDVKFENLPKVYVKEPFNLQLQIDCISPWPVIIESTSVQLGKQVIGSHMNILKDVELINGESGSEIVHLNIDEEYESPISLGNYIIEWRRANSKRFTKKLVSHLPQVKVELIPLYAEMLLPAVAWMHTPLAVTYILHNNSSNLLDLQLTMEPSVSFAFSGQKTLTLRILPESFSRLDYNFFPLYSGLITLPKLRVGFKNTSLNPQAILEMLERNLPSNIYVLPQSKGLVPEVAEVTSKQGV